MSCELALPSKTGKPKIIQSLIKKLQTSFNIRKSKDLDKANELAVYLLAVGLSEDALELLSSYIFYVEYNDSNGIWGNKVDGLGVLWYVGTDKDKEKCLAEITSRNFDKSDLSWLVFNAQDDIDYDEEITLSYEQNKSNYTAKERSEGAYTAIVNFLNYYILISNFLDEEHQQLANDAKAIVQRELLELKDVLK